MFVVDGDRVILTRGDSFYATVEIKLKSGGDYTIQPGDKVTFYLKHSRMNAPRTRYTDAMPLITKEIPTDTLVLYLAPEDTKKLSFGEYVYDVEMTFADGGVDTFINNAVLSLVPEVG